MFKRSRNLEQTIISLFKKDIVEGCEFDNGLFTLSRGTKIEKHHIEAICMFLDNPSKLLLSLSPNSGIKVNTQFHQDDARNKILELRKTFDFTQFSVPLSFKEHIKEEMLPAWQLLLIDLYRHLLIIDGWFRLKSEPHGFTIQGRIRDITGDEINYLSTHSSLSKFIIFNRNGKLTVSMVVNTNVLKI